MKQKEEKKNLLSFENLMKSLLLSLSQIMSCIVFVAQIFILTEMEEMQCSTNKQEN